MDSLITSRLITTVSGKDITFRGTKTFSSIPRLLKGDAPGRKQVSYYAGELNCIRNSKMFASR